MSHSSDYLDVPDRITFAALRATCLPMGYSVRRTGCGPELVAFPVGTSRNDPRSIFMEDRADMLATVRVASVRDARARCTIEKIIAFENDEMEIDDATTFLTDLRDCGLLFSLQGAYGRAARYLGIV